MIKSKRQKIRKTILMITFLIFPAIFYYFSPYLVIEGTIEKTISGSFVIFVLMFVSSLAFGRAYCGWVCPASEVQDQIINVNDNKISKGNIIKWIIWVPWILFVIFLAIKNGGYNKIDLFYRTEYGFSMVNLGALFIYLIVIILIVFPAFVIGKRSFCHHICWMAPFMIIGRKLRNLFNFSALQLISNPNQCINCHNCVNVCPMSLPVEDMVKKNNMENTECILCANCVDICTSKSIKLSFSKITYKKNII